MSLNKYAIKCQFCNEFKEVVNLRKIITCFNCKKIQYKKNRDEKKKTKKQTH